MSKLVVVLEGGPGVGKTSVARLLRARLEEMGVKTCVVSDGVRLFAPILAKIFGLWFRAPREVVEYMLLGWQVARFVECLSSDVIVMDYGPEAPLGYMEADGVRYPPQLEGLAKALLSGLKVIVALLEPPATYSVDDVRWEPPEVANRYRRALSFKALSLVSRVGAKALVVPEKDRVEERVEVLLREILHELG